MTSRRRCVRLLHPAAALVMLLVLSACSSGAATPPAPVPVISLTVGGQGVLGEVHLPRSPVPPGRTAVLLVGGSEGGLAPSTLARTLADADHPTLALAYFRGDRLPPALNNVAMEYFARALAVLADQPGVDPDRIAVWGISRGSEAALLSAVLYPDAVAAVVADSPSSTIHSAPPPLFGQPAWTSADQPLPRVSFSDFANPAPTSVPEAIIPVERAQGPIMTVCGGADRVWPSCAFANAIAARANTRPTAPPVTALDYPAAGHSFLSTGVAGQGRPPDNQAASEALPRVLAFLDQVP